MSHPSRTSQPDAPRPRARPRGPEHSGGRLALCGLVLRALARRGVLPGRLVLGGLVLVVALVSGVARAGQSPEERGRRANELAHSVMSPFCPGRTLWGCPSPDAAAWREDIRRWVDEGVSSEEIVARLQARAPGMDLSGAPPPSPLGWRLPALLGAGSLVLLVLVLTRLRAAGSRGGPVPAQTGAPQAPELGTTPTPDTAERAALDARLDAELETYDD